MAPSNHRGQCAVEAAMILGVLAAILLSLHAFTKVNRTLFNGVTLSKETR